MRKILLAGYYGFGNLGDELLARTMAKFLTERGFQINIIKKRSSFWRQIRKNDCLLFAGGSVFQDVSGRGFSLLYYAFWGFVAKLLGKKLFLAAQGIGPVACLFDRYILRVLLRCADFISVRDKRSAELLRKIGCKHFQTGVDLLFALKAKIYVKSGQKVAVNLRPFGHFRPEQGVRILTGRDVVYVPLQNGVDYGRGMTEKEVLRTISGARLAVGMRLHFIILSLLAGIPVVGIAYDPKVLSICEKFGLPYTTLDNLAVLPELIERELGRLSKTRGRLKKLLAAEQKLAGRTLNAVLEALRG